MTRQLRAFVIGGGIGGLATASALHRSGWRVNVHERSAGLPTEGTALVMWPAGMRALDAIGAGDAIRASSATQPNASITRADGTAMVVAAPRGQTRIVPRPALLRALLGTLPAGTVTWSSAAIVADGAGADLVVAADGIHSAARLAAFGERFTARAVGSTAFRGTVDGATAGVREAWGPGRLFGITPHDATRTNWFASVRNDVLAGLPAGLDDAAVLRHLFAGWGADVAAIVTALQPSGIDRRDLLDVAGLPSYVAGRTVLVGDAAHAMAPNLGRGACESLIDGVALAAALRGADTIEAGLRRYDRERRGSTQRLVRASRAMNGVSTAVRLAPVRDAAMGLVGRVTGSRLRSI